MDNLIGRRLDGRYLIQSLVGVGGMANVYRGVDEKTGNAIAVKVLKEEFLDNEELVRRFSVVAEEYTEHFSEIDNAVRKHGAHLIQGALDAGPEGLVGTFTISADSEDSMKMTTQAIRQIPSIKKIQGV